VVDTISGDRTPWVRDQILAEGFQWFRCRDCGNPVTVEKEVLYTDFERGHWIGVFPPDDEKDFKACEVIVDDTFRESFKVGPPAVRAWEGQFKVRVVFGLAELREKLLAWGHNLDDGVLELLKLDLLADRPHLVERGLFALRFDGIMRENDALAFVPRSFPATALYPDLAFLVPREVYDETARVAPTLAEAHAAMLAGPYVSIMRYFTAVAATAAPRERQPWPIGHK
jgi:hypothetical protein